MSIFRNTVQLNGIGPHYISYSTESYEIGDADAGSDACVIYLPETGTTDPAYLFDKGPGPGAKFRIADPSGFITTTGPALAISTGGDTVNTLKSIRLGSTGCTYIVEYDGDHRFLATQSQIGRITTSYPLSLPVPHLKLGAGVASSASIGTFNPFLNGPDGGITITKPPHVVALDLTQEMLEHFSIYVEMLVYRRGSTKVKNIHGIPSRTNVPRGFYVPSPYYAGQDSTFLLYPDWFRPPLLTGAAYSGFWTRMGKHYASTDPLAELAVDRPNHYRVTSVNQVIPVYEYLNNRYFQMDVAYRDSTGTTNSLTTTILHNSYKRAGKNNPTASFAYSPVYRSMYIAFRYVAFDQYANGGRGQILNGPISKTVKITHSHAPFIVNESASAYYGVPCADLNPLHDMNFLTCWIQNSVP